MAKNKNNILWIIGLVLVLLIGHHLGLFSIIPNSSKVLQLKLDSPPDALGNVPDSILSNNAQVTNAAWTSSGKFGGAYSFPSQSTYITVPDNSAYSISTTGEISVSFWMYMTSWDFPGQSDTKQFTNIIAKNTYNGGAQCEWGFRIYNQNGLDGTNARPCRISFYAFSPECGYGAGAYVQNNATANTCDASLLNRWVHIVGGVDANQNTFIYVDGQKNVPTTPNALSAYGVIPGDTTAPILIGKDYASGGGQFGGKIDEFIIFNKALSSLEVNELSTSTPEDCSCIGKVCGSNGCGGTCGACSPGQICSSGQCVVGTNTCSNGQTRTCTDLNGCAGTETCSSNTWESCVPTNATCGKNFDIIEWIKDNLILVIGGVIVLILLLKK